MDLYFGIAELFPHQARAHSNYHNNIGPVHVPLTLMPYTSLP